MSFTRVSAQPPAEKTAFIILIIISVCHLLNDMMQTLLSAIYPLLQSNYGLSFAQIGTITLTFQGTASILQPMVGFFIDRNPRPYSLAVGMGLTLVGAGAVFPGRKLSGALAGGGPGGDWLVGVSSRILTGGADGFGGPTWLSAVAVSGGGQCRFGHWPLACRAHRVAPWANKPCLVFPRGPAGHLSPYPGRSLVQGTRADAAQVTRRHGGAPRWSCPAAGWR